ncbi:MAG: hypothetical protein UY39_C0044G0002 [Candidatus Kaiserbacteria bacterium GW2011_GWC2_49_12]|uniref:Uncharacterized protein n=1 Tax=Candidatus Kaiserbacteria bacterium GW2011_GWC2_49_12 TaxID=1618675 RepID=A0A0G1VI12_9BACT|nr:MAG: hypothetical protein UY39_C0044G0002 [Candidatus Kaiserbacteria bacterium GW2011_GWC2_49_12]
MRNPNINVAVMILACVIVIVPSFSFAQITSTTEASSSSGGNTSGSGGYVVEGSSSASANATSIINARGEGEVEIEVETESNGVIHKESLRERINAMEAVKIRIATSSRGADARSEIRINMGEERPAAGTSTPRVSERERMRPLKEKLKKMWRLQQHCRQLKITPAKEAFQRSCVVS